MARRYVSAAALDQGAANAPLLKDERPSDQAEAFDAHKKSDVPDSTDITALHKAETTLTANAAMAGYELAKLADGTWEARRWGLVKPLSTIADAQAFLARVGVTQ